MREWMLRDVVRFATGAHKGQTRQHTGELYIMHPVRVSLMAADYGLTRYGIAAALLHDVVEDTRYTLPDVVTVFGGVVGGMVWGLTNAEARDVATVGVDNRATRKEMDREWLSRQMSEVKMLKAMDMMDNLQDWPVQDKFLDLMLNEASALMHEMSRAGVVGPDGGMQREVVVDFWEVWENVYEMRREFTTPPDEARDEG